MSDPLTDSIIEARRIAREVDADAAALRKEAETNAGLRIVMGIDDPSRPIPSSDPFLRPLRWYNTDGSVVYAPD